MREASINKYIVHVYIHHSVHTQYYYVVNYWQELNTGKHNATVGSNLKRKRCGSCQGCLAKDCMVCKFCHDKKKYGGLGKLKQCCEKKKCTTHVQEAKSKLPRIFQQPTAIHADPEPASIRDIQPKKPSNIVTHEEFVKVKHVHVPTFWATYKYNSPHCIVHLGILQP